MGETMERTCNRRERRLRNSGKDPQPPTRADPAAVAAAGGKGEAGDEEDEAHETMPCAPGRISSNSRQPGQRGGSLLSKRYFDPKTHKVYPGAPALFRNTEQRRIFVTLVTLPPRSQESEAHVKDGALESSSQPLAIFFEPGLRSEERINPSDYRGSIISCSSSGANVPGLSCNRNKLTKSLMDSSSSDILIDSIPEVDRSVNCISRKKKGKHHKKSMAKTVSTVLATQCEESISDSSVCETSLSTDTVSTSELNLENSMPENFSSNSLAVHHIMAEQDQSQMCRPYSTKIDKRTTCFSESSAGEEGNCNLLDRSLVSNHRAIASSSPESCEIVNAVCDDILSGSSSSSTLDKDTFCSTSETSREKDSCDTLYNTERAGNSCQASSSDGFQPVVNRKKNWLNKRASQNLNGIHRFGTHNMHDMIGKDRVHKNDINDVPLPTENAVSCQPGPCETQVILEEDIKSEGAPSTVTETSEVSPSTVTDTSEGTGSTVFDTSEGTPSIVTDTVKQISLSELKDMIQDLCLADSEDHKYMKAESENSHEDNELDNASLPEEKKDSLAPNIGGTGSSAAVVDESIPTSLKSKNEDELPISSSCDISAASNSCLMHKVKDQCFSGFETDLGKIVQVVDDSYRLQTISEGVRLVTGSPVAEFEKFVLSATPVLEKLSCRTCSPNQFIGESFCGHLIPNIPLRSLWQWYEKLGSYGMEVKAMDYNGSHKSCNEGFGFRAYFVPYLSAIQLFGRCRSSAGSNSYSNKEVREGGASGEGSNQWARSTHQDDGELLFEYFESNLPHQRRPLHEKIKQLIRGDTSSISKPFGDPLKLERLNLHDLHPASWYSVAWYPLYRIPDGNFRATFLTYYSLGNFVRVTSERPGCSGRLVSPVVGLQTYNAKGECWFRPAVSKTKECQTDLFPDPSEIMEGRIRMLEQAAFVMARATVCKGNEISVNMHPDFEFFLTRRW